MNKKGLFTCESVSAGHPDKLCDAVSDTILDHVLRSDPSAHVACETSANKDTIRVFGEITANNVDFHNLDEVVRGVVARIGYDSIDKCLDYNRCKVVIDLNTQSPDIAQGVNNPDKLLTGAGDQGLMFGYACDETPELMPYALMKAHEVMRVLDEFRHSDHPDAQLLYPDAKSQVTVRYNSHGELDGIDTLVVSSQHSPQLNSQEVYDILVPNVLDKVFGKEALDAIPCVYCNPTGRFVVGGPVGDAGLTGRKIIVDTYGGYAPHGGGAFSGKDATKVDRSAAYLARWLAKNIVRAGIMRECTVQLAYAIGVAEPVSFCVYGDSDENLDALTQKIRQLVDMRPYAIIERFGLTKPIFEQFSAYGHFGNPDAPWEDERLAAML